MKCPAVLGVESGPVTIEYVDTDGRTRTLRIEIDNQPPAVQITSPAHNTASDDHSPDFNGSLEDTDSGLVAESFRLVVDNDADGEENDDYVVKTPPAPEACQQGRIEGVTHGWRSYSRLQAQDLQLRSDGLGDPPLRPRRRQLW